MNHSECRAFARRQSTALLAYVILSALFLRVTTLTPHRTWAIFALGGYAVALLVSVTPAWRWAARIAVAGALLAPLLWEAVHNVRQPEITAVMDGAHAFLQTGSPYISEPTALSEYRPYLPVTFVFGILHRSGDPTGLTDPRWLALILLIVSIGVVTRAEVGRPHPVLLRRYCLLLSFPIVTLAIATSFIDIPMTALTLLCLWAAVNRRPILAGILAGLCLGIKPTGLCVAFVAIVFVARIGGRSSAAKYTVALVAAVCSAVGPFVWKDPGGLLRNTILFPLGLTDVESPAASPFPGVLLTQNADWGGTVALGILIAAGLLYGGYILWRPPTSLMSAAYWTAGGLTLATLLAPASRAGYLTYPLIVAGVFWAIGKPAPATSDATPSTAEPEQETIEADTPSGTGRAAAAHPDQS